MSIAVGQGWRKRSLFEKSLFFCTQSHEVVEIWSIQDFFSNLSTYALKSAREGLGWTHVSSSFSVFKNKNKD